MDSILSDLDGERVRATQSLRDHLCGGGRLRHHHPIEQRVCYDQHSGGEAEAFVMLNDGFGEGEVGCFGEEGCVWRLV